MAFADNGLVVFLLTHLYKRKKKHIGKSPQDNKGQNLLMNPGLCYF